MEPANDLSVDDIAASDISHTPLPARGVGRHRFAGEQDAACLARRSDREDVLGGCGIGAQDKAAGLRGEQQKARRRQRYRDQFEEFLEALHSHVSITMPPTGTVPKQG